MVFEKSHLIDEEEQEEKKKEKLTIKSVANNIMGTLSGCIIPTLPIMIVAGIFKMLVILFGPTQLGWLAEGSDLIVLFEMVGNAGYYFLPFYAAYSSAVKFKVSPMMALLFSGIMLSPNMIGIVEAAKSIYCFWYSNAFNKLYTSSYSYYYYCLDYVICRKIFKETYS